MHDVGGINGMGRSMGARNEEKIEKIMKELEESRGSEHRAWNKCQRNDHLLPHFLVVVQRNNQREKVGTSWLCMVRGAKTLKT
jgi:hypothetical protein